MHLAGVAEYFVLPRKLQATGEFRKEKAYPTLEQAWTDLQRLPAITLKDRRDRAIFAMAFVTGLRESALIGLRRTRQHYGKIDGARKADIFDAFDMTGASTIEELRLKVRYCEYDLDRGTAEFRRAAELVERRKRRH